MFINETWQEYTCLFSSYIIYRKACDMHTFLYLIDIVNFYSYYFPNLPNFNLKIHDTLTITYILFPY